MLVGDIPFGVSAVLALLVAVVAYGLRRASGRHAAFEFGSVVAFVVVTAVSLVADEPVAQHWVLALSFAGIFLDSLVTLLTGKTFVREPLAAGLPADVVKTELFDHVVAVMSWLWTGVFGAMAVSASIPSLIDPESTLFAVDSPLNYTCYWGIPTVLFISVALASTVLPQRMLVGVDDVARSTTFVAFAEAEIDQLLYLAQEHANKEVGAGKEAYNVRIGGKGTPLVGDDTRQSWPSTYKVRDKKR